MKYMKYMSLFLLTFVALSVRGQSDFNPSNPPEPSAYWLLRVEAQPAEAGTVTGGGKYVEGRSVTVKATTNSSAWRFVNWTNSAGEEVSTSMSFTYTVAPTNETLTANYVAQATSTVTLSYDPPSAGTNFSLSGAGTYAVGATVTISASSYSNWTFVNWTRRSDNEVMSADRSFTYTTTNDDVEFVAHYRFTPGSNPSEPSETKASHKVYFTANPSAGGYFSQSNGMSVREEQSFSVYAYNNSAYRFVNWTIDGVEVTTSRTYSGTMGTQDIYLVANYAFDPSAPSDPSADTQQRFTLYGQTVSLYQGETMLFPIYLENTSAVKELTFTLELPEGLTADVDNLQTTGRTSAYTPTASLSGQTLTVTLAGGSQISDVNGIILQIPVSTTAEATDGTFDVPFGTATATLTDDSTPTVTTRRGQVVITTLDEGDLLAQFSADRQMNRVQFTNLSTEGCKTFVWDFGDGETSTEVNPLHSYAEPGTYTVTLTARGLVKTSEATQSIIINAPSTWTASGDYTLDRNGQGVRNFVSVSEMLGLLSQCTPAGGIVVTVSDDAPYEMDVTTEEELAKVTTMNNRLAASSYLMQLVGSNELTDSHISFTASAVSEDLQAMMSFIEKLYTERTIVSLNNAPIDATVLRNIVDQTVCAESDTQELPLTDLSTSNEVTVEWEATTVGDHLTDYTASGTGNLTAMQIINNSGSYGNPVTEAVTYTINYKLSDVVMHTCQHTINVRPLMSRQEFYYSNPADNVTIDYGSTDIRWKSLGSAATSYTLNLNWTTAEGTSDSHVVNLIGMNYYTLDAIPGATYTWQVTAHGECDDITGPIRTFSVKKLPDLAVTIEAPETAKIQNTITLTATVHNIGEGATKRSYWDDALYASPTDNGIENATLVTTFHRNSALAADGSYTWNYNVVIPDNVEDMYYYYKVCYNYTERDVDMTNNVAVAHVHITANYVNDDDFEVLKSFYQTHGGTTWTEHWNLESNEINSTSWSGVTFNNEGRVTGLSLAGHNVTGQLTDLLFQLPYLKKLDLSNNQLTGSVDDFIGNISSTHEALEELTLTGNQLEGNIGVAGQKLPNLKKLAVGSNKIHEVNPVLPATITQFSASDQDLTDFAIGYNELFALKANMAETLPTILTYDHSTRSYTPSYIVVELSDDVNNPTWAGQVVLYTNSNNNYMGNSYSRGTQFNGWYKGENNVRLTAYGGTNAGRFNVDFTYTPGDVDFNTNVDLSDMQLLLRFAVDSTYIATGSSYKYYRFNYSAGNLIKDHTINVQDVVANINLLLEQDIQPELIARREQQRTAQMAAADESIDAYLYVKDGKLMIETRKPVAALDLVFSSGSIEWAPLMDFFSCKKRSINGGQRVIFYSLFGDEIPVGTHILGEVACDLLDATLVESFSDKLNVSLQEGETTGISTIDMTDTNLDAKAIYDLSGRKMNGIKLQKGVYVVDNQKRVIK